MPTDEQILEALMDAWVLGWYAGVDGVRNDIEKVKDARELLRRLKEEKPVA